MRSLRATPFWLTLLFAPPLAAQTGTAGSPPAPTLPAPAPEGEAAPAPGAAEPAPEPAAAPKPTAPAGTAAPKPADHFTIVDDREAKPPLIPDATDTLAGHFTLAAGLGFAVPFGDLEEKAAADDALALSPIVTLDAGIGVSRSIVLGAWGQYLPYSTASDCKDCSAKGFAVGPFIRYHLVQGMRFDPWMLLGFGYRSATITVAGKDADFSGFEWLHTQFGGDWYPTSNLGFGPYLGFDLGTFGDHPTSSADSTTHWQFATGLRLILDVPGK